jgi:hypothetical protein
MEYQCCISSWTLDYNWSVRAKYRAGDVKPGGYIGGGSGAGAGGTGTGNGTSSSVRSRQCAGRYKRANGAPFPFSGVGLLLHRFGAKV